MSHGSLLSGYDAAPWVSCELSLFDNVVLEEKWLMDSAPFRRVRYQRIGGLTSTISWTNDTQARDPSFLASFGRTVTNVKSQQNRFAPSMQLQ